MSTWIAHLRIAEGLLPHLPEVEELPFVYGSLAPDSGLPNDDWTVFDPPKEVTHFLRKGEGEESIRDGVFYKQYLAPIDPSSEGFRYSFCLGYFIHLLCDGLAARKIGNPTLKAFEREIASDEREAWGRIKNDWYGLDHLYLSSHGDSIFWRVFAPGPNPSSCLPFIPDPAFQRQMDYIRDFYSHADASWFTPRRYPYLNEKTMDRLVTESRETVLGLLSNRAAFESLPDSETTLCLAPASSLTPYDPPLGDP